MTNRKLTDAIMDEWRKHDAGQGIPYIKWAELAADVLAGVALSPPTPMPEKSDVDAAWVKASAEAILKANIRMTPNAQSFVAQTFARANQYPTVKFSPKQWEWFNKLMLDAGVESMEMVTLGAPRVDFVNNRGE